MHQCRVTLSLPKGIWSSSYIDLNTICGSAKEGTHFLRLLVICNVDGIWNIRRGPLILVVRVFWDALATLSSLRRAEVLEPVIAAPTMYVSTTAVELSWSTSWEGRYKFSKGPAQLHFVCVLSPGTGWQLAKKALPTMVWQQLQPIAVSEVTWEVDSSSKELMLPLQQFVKVIRSTRRKVRRVSGGLIYKGHTDFLWHPIATQGQMGLAKTRPANWGMAGRCRGWRGKRVTSVRFEQLESNHQ